MHLSPWLSSALTAIAMVATAAASGEEGIVQVDLAFPRNETYLTADWLPFVFAYQNAGPATYLDSQIHLDIWPFNDSNRVTSPTYRSYTFNVGQLNHSGDGPFFEYHGLKFDTEGVWLMLWELRWGNCSGNPSKSNEKPIFADGSMTRQIVFTIKNSAPNLDLVEATKEALCSNSSGIALNVTENLDVPASTAYPGGVKCPVLAAAPPAPSLCLPAIDSATASKVSASLASLQCRATSPVVGCDSDSEKGAAANFAVGLVTTLTVAVGAIGFLLF